MIVIRQLAFTADLQIATYPPPCIFPSPERRHVLVGVLGVL